LNNRQLLPALVGLTVAWGGTLLLLSPAVRRPGPPERLATQLLGQLALWMLLGLVVAIVVLWEREPLASIGLRPLGWSSLAWGLLLAAVMMYAVMPSLAWALRMAGIAGFEEGMAKVLMLPMWLRIIAVLTAGVVEDTLFIAYAFTRLTRLTGHAWLAGTIAVAVFALLHLPHWGVGPVLAYFVAIGVGTSFFAWRRDLLANIVAHVIVDGMGFVVMPAFHAR
jgi:membrane protease YdiL (CAAX protease family)